MKKIYFSYFFFISVLLFVFKNNCADKLGYNSIHRRIQSAIMLDDMEKLCHNVELFSKQFPTQLSELSSYLHDDTCGAYCIGVLAKFLVPKNPDENLLHSISHNYEDTALCAKIRSRDLPAFKALLKHGHSPIIGTYDALSTPGHYIVNRISYNPKSPDYKENIIFTVEALSALREAGAKQDIDIMDDVKDGSGSSVKEALIESQLTACDRALFPDAELCQGYTQLIAALKK